MFLLATDVWKQYAHIHVVGAPPDDDYDDGGGA